MSVTTNPTSVPPIAKWREGDRTVTKLPRGNHRISREDILASQRGRIIRAALEMIGEHGPGSLSVSEVVRRAGISRKAFYEQFGSFEDCVADAVMTANLVIGAEMASAAEAAAPTGQFDRIRLMIQEFCAMASEEPAITVAVVGNSYALDAPTRQVWINILGVRRAILTSYWETARGLEPTIAAATPERITAAISLIETSILEAIANDEAATLPSRAEVIADGVLDVLAGGSLVKI